MPATLSYPGVYIQEVPSGVRTITGVATSIAAFIGRAKRGPVDEPITINSFAEFVRIFGGLWGESTLGFSVRDFYQNGGKQAVIVRVTKDAKKASVESGGLSLEAINEGAWGNQIKITIDKNVSKDVADKLGVKEEDLFNLTIQDGNPQGTTEKHLNLTVANSIRRIDKVLETESRLLNFKGDFPSELTVPNPISKPVSATNGNDGNNLTDNDIVSDGSKQGINALDKLYARGGLFNMLCIPPHEHEGEISEDLIGKAADYCEKRRAMLLVDPPTIWTDKQTVLVNQLKTKHKNAAVFFPRIKQQNPLNNNRIESFVPCGVIAGIFARTDTERGVWKAPAGINASLKGVVDLDVLMTDEENGELNPLGINCLRCFPASGHVAWGARTLRGDDQLADEWKYIPVRRTALFIEESLFRGTQWVVFEPNDEPLWAQIRTSIGSFMHGLYRQGAFQGASPQEAYFVKCDKDTTIQDDINKGIVNIHVGFAPLKPAEFVVISIQQMAGQIQV